MTTECDSCEVRSQSPANTMTRPWGWTHGWKWLVFGVPLVALLSVAAWVGESRLRVPRNLSEITAMLARQEWSRAEPQLRSFLNRDPQNPAALLLLGRCLGGRGELREAASVLQSVPADSDERRDALLGAGLAWKTLGHRRAAEKCWLECLELPRGELEPPELEIQCLRQLCDMYALERRRAELWNVSGRIFRVAEPRKGHESLAMRVRYLFEMVDPVVAIGLLRSALQEDPDDYETRRAIGLYHLEANQLTESRAQLFRCVQQQPDDLVAWEAWCDCLHKDHDLFGFERAIDRLPAAADYSAYCWKYRSILAEQQGKLDEAVTAMERSVAIAPSEPELHHRLGQLMVRIGNTTTGQQHLTNTQELRDAQDTLRNALDSYRKYWVREPARRPEIAGQFAQAYEALVQPGESEHWYRVALSEDPTHATSIAALERLLRTMHAQSSSVRSD